ALLERLRAADDLRGLLRNTRLTLPVVLARVDAFQLLRVVGRELHRETTSGLLRRGGLDKEAIDALAHRERQERLEDRARVGLEDELRVAARTAAALGLLDRGTLDRQDLRHLGLLRGGREI